MPLIHSIFVRAEKLIGNEPVRFFLSVLAVSTSGLSEANIAELARMKQVTWSALHFARLRRCFKSFLTLGGDQALWNFCRPEMRQAAISRYLAPGKTLDDVDREMSSDPPEEMACHALLAQYLVTLTGPEARYFAKQLHYHHLCMNDKAAIAKACLQAAKGDTDSAPLLWALKEYFLKYDVYRSARFWAAKRLITAFFSVPLIDGSSAEDDTRSHGNQVLLMQFFTHHVDIAIREVVTAELRLTWCAACAAFNSMLLLDISNANEQTTLANSLTRSANAALKVGDFDGALFLLDLAEDVSHRLTGGSATRTEDGRLLQLLFGRCIGVVDSQADSRLRDVEGRVFGDTDAESICYWLHLILQNRMVLVRHKAAALFGKGQHEQARAQLNGAVRRLEALFDTRYATVPIMRAMAMLHSQYGRIQLCAGCPELALQEYQSAARLLESCLNSKDDIQETLNNERLAIGDLKLCWAEAQLGMVQANRAWESKEGMAFRLGRAQPNLIAPDRILAEVATVISSMPNWRRAWLVSARAIRVLHDPGSASASDKMERCAAILRWLDEEDSNDADIQAEFSALGMPSAQAEEPSIPCIRTELWMFSKGFDDWIGSAMIEVDYGDESFRIDPATFVRRAIATLRDDEAGECTGDGGVSLVQAISSADSGMPIKVARPWVWIFSWWRYRSIDALLRSLERQDLEWRLRNRMGGGAPLAAVGAAERSALDAFGKLRALPRSTAATTWIVCAVQALRQAEIAFRGAGYNDPDSFGAAIYVQLDCELSRLYEGWTGCRPESAFSAMEIAWELQRKLEAVSRELFEEDFEVCLAFNGLTQPESLPQPSQGEGGPEFLARVRQHLLALALANQPQIDEARKNAIWACDQVIENCRGRTAGDAQSATRAPVSGQKSDGALPVWGLAIGLGYLYGNGLLPEWVSGGWMAVVLSFLVLYGIWRGTRRE